MKQYKLFSMKKINKRNGQTVCICCCVWYEIFFHENWQNKRFKKELRVWFSLNMPAMSVFVCPCLSVLSPELWCNFRGRFCPFSSFRLLFRRVGGQIRIWRRCLSFLSFQDFEHWSVQFSSFVEWRRLAGIAWGMYEKEYLEVGLAEPSIWPCCLE